jgi:hypothetical protein
MCTQRLAQPVPLAQQQVQPEQLVLRARLVQQLLLR